MLDFSGIVLVKKVKVQENARKYDFSVLEVGDSMLDEGVKSTVSSRLRTAAAHYGQRAGKKFSAKQEEDGVRVTRTI